MEGMNLPQQASHIIPPNVRPLSRKTPTTGPCYLPAYFVQRWSSPPKGKLSRETVRGKRRVYAKTASHKMQTPSCESDLPPAHIGPNCCKPR